jgi:hypothetical protein
MTAVLARLMDALLLSTHRAVVAGQIGNIDGRQSAASANEHGLSLAETIGIMNSAGSH